MAFKLSPIALVSFFVLIQCSSLTCISNRCRFLYCLHNVSDTNVTNIRVSTIFRCVFEFIVKFLNEPFSLNLEMIADVEQAFAKKGLSSRSYYLMVTGPPNVPQNLLSFLGMFGFQKIGSRIFQFF